MTSGIKVVAEDKGAGTQARKGDLVAFDCAAFLNKGTEVHPRRSESLVLGSRRFIAGVEAALVGMCEGGYRKVRISPHLAYRAAGVDGVVPRNAVLIYELWLTSVQKRGLTPKSRGTRARAARATHLERKSAEDMVMRIEIDDITRPQVLALLGEHLRNMYELSPPDQVFAFDASKLLAPGVVFWTAWKDGTLLGCAALKELSLTEGEVKSMRTPAGLRRNGAGRALLNHILKVSRERGYQELFLETGRHPAFAPAQTLYRSVGFRECGAFGSYRENGNSVFMSLQLSESSAR